MNTPNFKLKKTLLPFITAFIALAGVVSLYFLTRPQKIATYTPKPNKVFTVIIDAGHGGKDEGTKTKTVKEKEITLAIAKQIEALAPKYNVKVILTRHTDTFMNPVARVNFAMQHNADAYVALHVNELRGYSYVSGMQVYISGKNPDFDQSRLLGSAVAQNLGADFKISHTLQQRIERIYVLAENYMPSILVECGFITNPADLKLLTDSTKTLIIAQQVLTGIQAYANHNTINAFAVQQLPSVTARRKTIIATNTGRGKKLHHKGSKAV